MNAPFGDRVDPAALRFAYDILESGRKAPLPQVIPPKKGRGKRPTRRADALLVGKLKRGLF
jgi:hypothetical protein